MSLGFTGQLLKNLLAFTVDGIFVCHDILYENPAVLADLPMRDGLLVEELDEERTGDIQYVGRLDRAAGTIAPSQWLRKFASYPRQHDLAVALREIGRVERTLFIIDWVLDPDMRRRAQLGLNKGEAHHALKNALRIGRQGEIRDSSSEGQHYRMAGLNLLAAIVIYWNTAHLADAVAQRKHAGLPVEPKLLTHISPLG